MKNKKFKFHIGMRNIKTGIAATICALAYLLIERNPTFACIGAVFGTGSDMGDSWLNGGNRLFGTIIGGCLGMALFSIYIAVYPEGYYPGVDMKFLMLPLLFVGVTLLIIASQLFKWPGAIQPGGVMLCIILFRTPVETYITYSLERMLDTGIGVIVALIINLLLPRERIIKILESLHLRKKEAPAIED